MSREMLREFFDDLLWLVNPDREGARHMATQWTLVDSDTSPGQYGVNTTCALIADESGRRVYIADGWGGGGVEGETYRWRQGVAVEVLPGDTLAELRRPDGAGNTPIAYALHAPAETDRRQLDWSGDEIERIARSLCI